MPIFENHIQELMGKHNLSYSDMAKLTGLPKSTLQRYATGPITKIPEDKLAVIAKSLNVSSAYLYGIRSEMGEATNKIYEEAKHRLGQEDDELVFDELDEEIVDLILSLSPEKKQEALHYLQYLSEK